MRVWSTDHTLHVANTGAPLDVAGVQALSALRASAKRADAVGRFGVGFTAVLSVADEVEVRSTAGSVRFSLTQTRNTLHEHAIEFDARPPVLRLPWAVRADPLPGYDTEVVLQLRADVDLDVVLMQLRHEIADILLELPALQSIWIGDEQWRRDERPVGERTEVAIGADRWWQYDAGTVRWLAPIGRSGRVRPVRDDVLRAPTRSDEQLSIPAIIIGAVAMQPDRRRVLPGAHVAQLATGYADFVRSLPVEDRLAMVPAPGFARSEVDGILREAVLDNLRRHAWLPALDRQVPIPPGSASVLPGLTSELAELLTDVVPGLLPPELSTPAAESVLAVVDVHRVGLAHLTELLAGIERPPTWWRHLYAALEPLVVDNVSAEELGALPVPLADGRLVTGPRTVLLGSDITVEARVGWARLVHPDAAHDLLGRLGARSAAAADLLADAALQDMVEAIDRGDEIDSDPAELVDGVLALAGVATGDLPSWLGLLPLPDVDGELRPADELLLPDAPLAEVVVADSPFAAVDPDLVQRFGADALRRIGVGWGFAVLRVDLPTGPDHALDDEDAWWRGLPEDPETLVAVRDLDLVEDKAWPAALTMLAADSQLLPVLADRDGYTAWWLRRHAHIDGQPLGHLRSAADRTLAGLLDELTHPQADALTACLADPAHVDTDLAQLLIDRLSDSERTPTAGVITTAYRLLATAADSGRIDADAVVLPALVRTVSGALVEPDAAMVLDAPWLAPAVSPDRLVLGDIATAAALSRLVDLPLTSEAVRGEVMSSGRTSSWEAEPAAVLACACLGLPLPAGSIEVHDDLQVRLTGAVEGVRRLPAWVDADGRTHLTVRGLGSSV
nr:ATP-binding protein [Skermania sp. ID1734]